MEIFSYNGEKNTEFKKCQHLVKIRVHCFLLYLFEKKKILWFLQCKIGGAPTRCSPAVPLLAFVVQTTK